MLADLSGGQANRLNSCHAVLIISFWFNRAGTMFHCLFKFPVASLLCFISEHNTCNLIKKTHLCWPNLPHIECCTNSTLKCYNGNVLINREYNFIIDLERKCIIMDQWQADYEK